MNISKKDREKAEEFMNEKRAVEELIAMSVRVGNRPDYVQAGGGNSPYLLLRHSISLALTLCH